jgi:hypothetical protein
LILVERDQPHGQEQRHKQTPGEAPRHGLPIKETLHSTDLLPELVHGNGFLGWFKAG